MKELAVAIKYLQSGMNAGPDRIGTELILNVGNAILVMQFLLILLALHQDSKIWKRFLVVAIPNQNKPSEDLNSYRAVFLLCIPFNVFKRLILARVGSIIFDPLLSTKQSEFRRSKSIIDQVTLLAQIIEDDCLTKETAGVVFWPFSGL